MEVEDSKQDIVAEAVTYPNTSTDEKLEEELYIWAYKNKRTGYHKAPIGEVRFNDMRKGKILCTQLELEKHIFPQMAKDIVKNRKICYSQVAYNKEGIRLFGELDCDYPVNALRNPVEKEYQTEEYKRNINRQLRQRTEQARDIICNVVRQYFPDHVHLTTMLLLTAPPRLKKEKVHMGIHFVFPDLVLQREHLEQILHHLEMTFIALPYMELDMAVLDADGGHLRMMGNYKVTTCVKCRIAFEQHGTGCPLCHNTQKKIMQSVYKPDQMVHPNGTVEKISMQKTVEDIEKWLKLSSITPRVTQDVLESITIPPNAPRLPPPETRRRVMKGRPAPASYEQKGQRSKSQLGEQLSNPEVLKILSDIIEKTYGAKYHDSPVHAYLNKTRVFIQLYGNNRNYCTYRGGVHLSNSVYFCLYNNGRLQFGCYDKDCAKAIKGLPDRKPYFRDVDTHLIKQLSQFHPQFHIKKSFDTMNAKQACKTFVRQETKRQKKAITSSASNPGSVASASVNRPLNQRSHSATTARRGGPLA